MPITHVRPVNASHPAIFTGDDDWQEIATDWLRQYGADEEQAKDSLAQMIEAVAAERHKPWLIATREGIAAVSPQTFAADFEDVASTSVLDEIYAERLRQIGKGYDTAHDDTHGLTHLLDEAAARLNSSAERATLVESAALLVAAIDYLGRAEAVKAALEVGEPS